MWAERIIGTSGAPDFLINNAGLMNLPAPLWQVPVAEVSKLIDVNIKGVINVIRAFVPAMVEARRGVIVNLSSSWGRSTSPAVAPTATVPASTPLAAATEPPAVTEQPTVPEPAPTDPYAAAKAAGATAVCADGSWSNSKTRSGTCSGHGGVHWWTGNVGAEGPGDH